MKHILFLTHYFPPEVTAGANRTFEHVQRWQQKGYKITIITNYPNHPNGKIYNGYRNKWLSKETFHDIDVLRIKTYLTPNRGTFRRTFSFLFYAFMAVVASMKVKKIDCIVATSPQFFSGLAGSIVKNFKRKPFILEIRDLWPDSIVAVGALKETNIILKMIRIMEKNMYFSATHIVSLTNAFKEHIKEFGYPEDKISIIPNSVDLKQMGKIIEIETEFKKENKFVCSYIGTFGMAHKVETILYCAEKLKNESHIQFLLIGDGADREHLVNLKKELDLSNVTILHLQPKEYIPYFLNQSDVGLIVLRNNKLFETVIPSKIFEYMAMNNSLILSLPAGETTGMLKDSEFGVTVEPENAEKLAEKILYLFQNPEVRERMSLNGKRLVENYYNRDNLSSIMLQLIEKEIENANK